MHNDSKNIIHMHFRKNLLRILRSFRYSRINCIHWVATPCTTTAYVWLFRDSHPSLRSCWSAVIKSPDIFLLEVLHHQCVSCKEPSWSWSSCVHRNFGLSRSECKHCFPDTTVLGASESDSREVLAGASPDADTPSSTTFLGNHPTISGRSRNKCPCTGSVSLTSLL